MDKLADRMKRLLITSVDGDVHFLVGQGDKQEFLRAHKPIMRVASDVFAAMFRYDEKFPISVTQNPADEKASQKEGNSPVEIPDVNVEAFKTMLSFIYTDDLSGVNGQNAIDVLYAAKKYNLPSLVRACMKIPIKKLSNVFIALSTARLLDEKNAEDLIESNEFLQIDQKLLCELLGRNQLVVSGEYRIWFSALRWAIEQCKQNGVDCSANNYRQMLGPALFKIRFPIIKKHFLEDIASSGVLSSDELALACSGKAVSELYPLPFSDHRRSANSNKKLLLKIENFSDFARQKELKRKFSDAIYISGVLWKIFAQIETKNDIKYLGFFIQCNADDYGTKWNCTCLASMCVVPQNGDEKTKPNDSSKTICQSFGPKDKECWGLPEFMAFEKLLDPNAGWYSKEEDTVTLSADVSTVGLCDYSDNAYYENSAD
ncbi:hypothetical protein niasHT_027820 [Heterodera trifolii]|uniref:BTB domain-containing protein n=1 Tax=Heterodera trifolii TaxID=157864 RepID=A0ABD2JSD8_9BILA